MSYAETDVKLATPRNQVADLTACIDANVPVLLIGQPGTAKTAMLERIAADRGMYLEVLIASAQDPTTILGIPMPSEDRKHTEQTIPGWARRINAADAAGLPTMLFLDELSTVAPVVVGPLLGVVQSRRADGWTIPAATRIVAAANPPETTSNGGIIAPAMANRWAHIAWAAPWAEWLGWARGETPAPTPPQQVATTTALASVAAFLEAVPELLLVLPDNRAARSGPWPSPRSWTNAAQLVNQTGDASIARLAVGDKACDAFVAWIATRDVPTVADLLAGAALPTRPDAFTTAIRNVVAQATGDTLARTLTILRDGIKIDPAVIAIEAVRLASMGHHHGLPALVDDLQAAGIDIMAVAAQSASESLA